MDGMTTWRKSLVVGENHILCPVCGDVHQHLTGHAIELFSYCPENLIPSEFDPVLVLFFEGECGSSWKARFSRDKGRTQAEADILKSCKEACGWTK